MDPEGELERVGRPTRPALVVGAWAVGLVVVIGAALVGATTSRPGEAVTSPRSAPMGAATPRAATTPVVAAVASPRPTPIDRGFPRPFHPTQLGPPVHEDRRIDGTAPRPAGTAD